MNQVIARPLLRSEVQRVQAIDVVRGLVMVVMALDHIREFWSPTAVRPEDVAQASVLLFFTRWITHFCAPTFVFLSGASIFLYQQRKRSQAQVSGFLLSRGLWLVSLEVVVINFILQWGHYNLLLLQVIWAIGWGMVLLAGLIWLPRWLLVGLAALIIIGHDALPVIQPVTGANAGLALLHNSPFLLPLPSPLPPLLVAYSVGPWLGVLLAGYLIGPWFGLPLAERNRRLRLAGIGLLALFGALRATNWYGDPSPWSVQPRGVLYSGAVLPRRHEIPALAAVSVPDAGRGAAAAQPGRNGQQPAQSLAAHLRPGAIFLLPAAFIAHQRRRLGLEPAGVWAPVQLFVRHPQRLAGRLSAQPAAGLRGVGERGRAALPALSVVSGLQAAALVLVAVVFVAQLVFRSSRWLTLAGKRGFKRTSTLAPRRPCA